MKKWFKGSNLIRLGIINIIILLLLLCATEIVLRVLSQLSRQVKALCFYRYDGNQKFLRTRNTTELLKHAPFPLGPYTNYGWFLLNSRGFRTPEYQFSKTPGSTRIVFIGDSFCSDSGNVLYPNHFTVLLEQKIKSVFNKEIEVINLGYPAIGPRFEKKILELEGIWLNPDLVIWCFFVGNDFTDDELPILREEKKTFKEYLFSHSYICRAIRNSHILLTHTQVVNIRKAEWKKGKRGGIYIGPPKEYDPDKPSCSREEFLKIQSGRMRMYVKETFPWDNLEAIKNIFLEVKSVCTRLKINLLVVIIPDVNQIDRSLLTEIVKDKNWVNRDLQLELPQELLSDFFVESKIEYLDLLPMFRQWGLKENLYGVNDTHWNNRGNFLAAEAIFAYLYPEVDQLEN